MTSDDCTAFDALIDRVHGANGANGGDSAEPLTASESAALLDHLDSCSGCSELSDLLAGLASSDSLAEAAMPSPREFARLREAVLSRLEEHRAPAAAKRFYALPWAAGVALLLLGSGFLLGKGSSSRRLDGPSGGSVARYENVRVDAQPDGRLRLSFDTVRPVEVEVSSSDPLAVEVLAQALTDASTSVGERLRAVELAASLPQPRLRQALGMAMRHDENLGVRLAAQRGLVGESPATADADAEQAMLDLLRTDGPLPMYLIAIDYLEKRGVEPWRVREALRASRERHPTAAPAALLLARSESASGFLEDLPRNP